MKKTNGMPNVTGSRNFGSAGMNGTASLLGVALLLGLHGCGDVKKVEETEEKLQKENKLSASLAAVDDISDLKLSSALNISVPSALSASAESSSGSQSLRLTEPTPTAKKSREACMVGQSVSDAARRVKQVAGLMCHLEVEKAKIKIGKKYLLKLSDGQEFGRLWAEKRESEGKFVVSMCMKGMGNEQGASKEIVEVSGVTEYGAKGKVFNAGSFEFEGVQGTYRSASIFDTSEKGTTKITSFDVNSQGEDKHARHVDMTLIEGGISLVKLAFRGTNGGSSFGQRALALFKGDYGTALTAATGNHQGQEFTFSKRSYFDKQGNVVEAAASSEFQGDLKAAASSIPSFLKDDFKPDEDAGAWAKASCKETEETVTIAPMSEAHAACETPEPEHTQCWDDSSYAEGQDDSIP